MLTAHKAIKESEIAIDLCLRVGTGLKGVPASRCLNPVWLNIGAVRMRQVGFMEVILK